MSMLEPRQIRHPILLALTIALLGLVLYRGAAVLLSDPLLALANNYDMIRVHGCIKAYPIRAPGISPFAGSAEAPLERYRFRYELVAPCFTSSEVLFARLARPLFKAESLRSGDGSFSIRWVGLVKFIVFFSLVTGFCLAWWRQGKPTAAAANAVIAAVVLTDPAVTLYLIGFYAEYAVVVFGYASLAGAALLLGRDRPPGITALFLLALAVAALAATKLQHLGLGLIVALTMALPFLLGARGHARVIVAVAIGGIAGLAIQAPTLRSPDTETMRLANLTSTVLTTLLPLSDDPARTAAHVGIPARCGAYAGLNWYLPPVRENPANHPCPEVAQTSYARLLGLAFTEPAVFGRFVFRSLAYIRPWIPTNYRGEPHLGVVAGQPRGTPLPQQWFSWSRVLDPLPMALIYVLVVAPALIMAGTLLLRRMRSAALAGVLTTLALAPYPVILAVIVGNGYEDAAKQMHLVFTLVLSYWVLLTMCLVGQTWSRIWRDRFDLNFSGPTP